MNERLKRLDRIAELLHEHQRDRQGAPYIEHLRAVAAGVTSESEKAVALFHDALEDGASTGDELAGILTANELAAVKTLTRDEHAETYSQFIERIAEEPGRAGELARAVKRADLAHNIGRLTPELEHLREKYTRAAARLA